MAGCISNSRINSKRLGVGYVIPTSKPQLILDFYTLVSLPTWGFKPQHSDLKEVIETNQTVMVNYMRDHLLKVVYRTICYEFRHTPNMASNWRCTVEEYFIKRNKLAFLKEIKASNRSRKAGYRICKKHFTPVELVNFAKYAFTNFCWESQFGGKPWADVTKAWLKLYYAQTFGDKLVAIDHIFDLEHNNGTIFDKAREYRCSRDIGEIYRPSGYWLTRWDWIPVVLTFKAESKSLWDFWEYISPNLRRLLAKSMKAAYGQTYSKNVLANAV